MTLPGVYIPKGAAPTFYQEVMAACAWAGEEALASHRTAARLWDLDGIAMGRRIEVVTTARVRTRGIFVHRVEDLPPSDYAVRHRIPVTRIERTIFDLGSSAPPKAVDVAIDCALRRSLTSIPALRRFLLERGGRGRRGAGVLRQLLALREDNEGPAHSAMETELFGILVNGGLPRPVRQFEVWHLGRFIARPDLAYPRERIAIEADSQTWHSSPLAQQADLDRQRELEAVGWVVRRVPWYDMDKPHKIVAGIRRLRSERLALRSFPA
jgi:very-short-patch-repair endonuclease